MQGLGRVVIDVGGGREVRYPTSAAVAFLVRRSKFVRDWPTDQIPSAPPEVSLKLILAVQKKNLFGTCSSPWLNASISGQEYCKSEVNHRPGPDPKRRKMPPDDRVRRHH
jgi:hypothetical protein